MAFIDYSDLIGGVLTGMNATSGSLFLSLLMLIIFLLALCLAFNLPIEISIIIVFPVCLAMVLVTQQMMTVAGVFMIYLAVIMARRVWWA